MAHMLEWPNEAVLRLIQEYKKKRELWDNSDGKFRVYSAKYAAWKELANAFGCDTVYVKRKMNSVLTSHRRERHKVSQGIASNWFAYPYLKFIENKFPIVKCESDETPEEDELSEFEAGDPDYEKEEIRKTKHKQKMKRLAKSNLAADNTSANKGMEKRLLNAINSMKHEKGNKKDACQIFGDYVANTLRQHDHKTKAIVKHAINNILFETEMKKYSLSNMLEANINMPKSTNPQTLLSNDCTELIIEENSGDEEEFYNDRNPAIADHSYE